MSEERNISGSAALKPVAPNVLVIEATTAPVAERLRVAAYARVSSDSDDQLNSFSAQVRYYNNLIQSKDTWRLVDVYADEGITGTSTCKREDFLRLMNDSRRGQIDIILCKSLSRFARNAVDCLEALRELKRLGVTVRFEKENLDTAKMQDETITAFYATFSQHESESISGNMRWSYQRRMQSGQFVTCKAPFGYNMVSGKLEINEGEAQIVREIFDSYLSGESLDKIAVRITQLGIPTRDGKPVWTRATLNYIIKNEKYCGNALLQKKYTTPTLPYQKKRNSGSVPQYFVKDSHPAIISPNIFERAQELRKCRSACQPSMQETYPLSKMMSCGECGSVFSRKANGDAVYWFCRKHSADVSACSVMQIPEEEIYTAFLRLYNKLKMHQDIIIAPLITQLQTLKRKRMLWSKEIIELTNQIADITEQDRKLNGLKTTHDIDPAYYLGKSAELAEKLRTLKQEKERLMLEKADDMLEKNLLIASAIKDSPDFLSEFDSGVFHEIVDHVVVLSNDRIAFRLHGGLALEEGIERTAR